MPGPSLMRRLTRDEYGRALRDLLGGAAPARDAVSLPDENYQDGFDNQGEAQAFNAAHLRGFRAAARAAVGALASDAAARDRVLGCTPAGAGRPACLSSFVARFGRRAFRRPLTAEETRAYTALAEAPAVGSTPEDGPLAVVEAMLSAPSFLFLVEAGVPVAGAPGVVRLDPYERATRLAFLLWGSLPDDRLLDDARDGVLDRRDGLLAAARRLLADPRAAEGRWAFASRWLRVHELRDVEIEGAQAVLLTRELRASMEEETRRLVAAVTAPDGRVTDLLTASETALDARLAKHYGIPRPSSARDWAPMDVRAHKRGAGLLTQGAFLVATAKTRINTPIRRATYLREVLICRPPPPAPAEIPSIDAVNVPKNSSVPTLLSAHRSNPSCAGCHALLEPLGFGLEAFGRLGEWRAADEYGHPIDGRGQLVESTPPDFTGPVELGAKIAELPEFPACAARQLFRYGAGRHESDSEACALDALGASVAGGSFVGLIEALVTSDLLHGVGKGN